MKKILYILMATIFTTSCGEFEIYNTYHPDTGGAVISISLPDGVTLTNDYIVELEGESYTPQSDGTVILPTDIQPGTYTIYVYSVSDGVNVGTAVASVEMADDTYLRHDPEHLYFGTQEITIMADAVISSSVELRQITASVDINLAIVDGDPDDVVSAKATISGIASEWDCVADEAYGNSSIIAPPITQGAALVRSSDNGYLTTSVNILGTNDTKQILTIAVTMSDGIVRTTTSELTSKLAALSSDKSTPLTLAADLSVPTATQSEITISPWVDGDTITGDIFEPTN